MRDFFYTNSFKKDIKKVKKRGLDTDELKKVITLLIEEKELDKKYKNHKLSGNWKGYFDCHIADDWVLVYKIEDKTVIFQRTGTHQDIFE